MRVILHGEWSDDLEFGWWAESPDHPEFSAAADHLAELKGLVKEAAELYSWSAPEFELALPGPAGTVAPGRSRDGATPTVVDFAAA